MESSQLRHYSKVSACSDRVDLGFSQMEEIEQWVEIHTALMQENEILLRIVELQQQEILSSRFQRCENMHTDKHKQDS